MSREFDPNRKYKVVLGQRLLDSADYGIASIKLDPDLKLPPNVKSASISHGFSSTEYQLALAGIDGKESTYVGQKHTTKTCALIYDQADGVFSLERIDAEFAFAADNHTNLEDQTEAGILRSLIEDEGPADEDNPFDWRHQLQRQRTPTPELDHFRLDTSAAPSPAQKPFKSRIRQASSPPAMSIDFEEPSPLRQSQTQPEEIVEEESDEDGGLQISWEGAAKPRNGFRGRLAQRASETGPISLRSAANSQSPAVHREATPESDGDVEQIQLGSPLKVEKPAEVEIEELDFEAEFERAMEGDDEDDTIAPAPEIAYQAVNDSSSEESEEE